MEIEVGKTYLTRSGKKVEIVAHMPRSSSKCDYLGVVDKCDHHSFSKDGRFTIAEESSLDLVEESPNVES